MTFLIRKMSHHKKGGQKSLWQAKVEALCLVKSFYNRWFSESQPKSVINSDLWQAKTELLRLMRHKSYWGRLVLTSDCCNGCYVLRWIQHFIRNSPHSLSSVDVIKCPFSNFRYASSPMRSFGFRWLYPTSNSAQAHYPSHAFCMVFALVVPKKVSYENMVVQSEKLDQTLIYSSDYSPNRSVSIPVPTVQSLEHQNQSLFQLSLWLHRWCSYKRENAFRSFHIVWMIKIAAEQQKRKKFSASEQKNNKNKKFHRNWINLIKKFRRYFNRKCFFCGKHGKFIACNKKKIPCKFLFGGVVRLCMATIANIS